MTTLALLSAASKRLGVQKTMYRFLKLFPVVSCDTSISGFKSAVDFCHQVSPDKGGSCISAVPQFDAKQLTYDLEVIIPVYNVEQYVEECVDSVLAQVTDFTYHVTLVNDGSTDNSRALLSKYEKDSRVTIIDQKNQGAAVARNTALANLKGRYVTFVDSDDRLPQNAVDLLMRKAVDGDYDIVEGGYVRFKDNGQVISRTLPGNKISGYPCMKVFKSSIWQNLRFPAGYSYEDTVCGFIINDKYHKTATVNDYVYEYRRNTNSVSFRDAAKPKSLDTLYITLRLLKDRVALGLPMDDGFRGKLLYQFAMNTRRLQSLKWGGVKYANFIISRALYSQYYGDRLRGGKSEELEKSLVNGDYKGFVLASLLL